MTATLNLYHTKADFETSECETAVLPVGAIEQHGSHLPVGTDTLLARHFGEGIAVRTNAYLLPVLPISSSIEHRLAKGTVYLKSDTLGHIVRDIAHSLHFSGFRKLIIANVHGGNWILKPTIRNLNREIEGMQVILLNLGDVAAHRHHEIFEHVKNEVHGGEFETSLMMHLYPQHVGKIRHLQNEPEFVPQSYLDYFDTTEITEDGYWGYPEAADAGKGAKAMDLLIESAMEYLERLDTVTKKVRGRVERADG